MPGHSGCKAHVIQPLMMAGLLAASSAIGFLFRRIGFPETNIVIVYLLTVLMAARLTDGFAWGILASVIATFLFNYFFTEPYLTFAVNDPNYFITFVIMTITALITSTVTSHAKRSALLARQKEAEAKAVYHLTNHLTDAKDVQDIAAIAAGAIGSSFSCQAACLCFDESGMPEPFFVQQGSDGGQTRRETGNAQEIKRRIDALRTGYDAGDEFHDWPIYGRESVLGLIRIPKESASAMNEAQIRLLRSMIENTALAMDRFRSAQQRIHSREETAQERYRGNLLRAISHDLRTPLSGIMGTSEMLMDMTRRDDPRYSLASDIHKDADWLHSLVENILSLTRLQEGGLMLHKQMEAVEEVLGSAVDHIAKRSPEHEITVNAPHEFLLVPMDVRLITQVLINLLDNAINHTPPGREIGVSVTKDEAARLAVFVIRDEGSGIPKDDLPHIFQMFYTSQARHSDAKHGIGLGLAICDAIVKAHGGSIVGRNRADAQGAEFVFTLPLEVEGNKHLS